MFWQDGHHPQDGHHTIKIFSTIRLYEHFKVWQEAEIWYVDFTHKKMATRSQQVRRYNAFRDPFFSNILLFNFISFNFSPECGRAQLRLPLFVSLSWSTSMTSIIFLSWSTSMTSSSMKRSTMLLRRSMSKRT